MYLTYYIIPVFLSILLIVGIKKNSYESFINGCKRGVEIALDAFPYLLAMIFATKLLNSSMIFMNILKNYDIPHLLFLEGIFRPMSNNASLSILIQIFNDFGIDSLYFYSNISPIEDLSLPNTSTYVVDGVDYKTIENLIVK